MNTVYIKSSFIVALFLLITLCSAQERHETPKTVNISPLSETNSIKRNKSWRSEVERVLYYELDMTMIREASVDPRITVEMKIPTLVGEKTVSLNRFALLGPNYSLSTEKSKINIPSNHYRFYSGQVKGDPNSKVGLTISEDRMHLFIYDSDGSFQISRLSNENIYSGIFAEEIKNIVPFQCHTDTDYYEITQPKERNNIKTRGTLDCVEVYLEVDYKSYQENGSNTSDVENWALAIMAQVAIFFQDTDVPLRVSGIKVYTSADPYISTSNTSQMLSAFTDSMRVQGFEGRLAHLLSGRGVGGGRAYLGVLCNKNSAFGVSGNLTSGGTTYTNYIWNIAVIAHEIGHNFGSRHTHDCAWNGNNTQIDDCGNVYNQNNGYNSGSCYDNGNRILPGSQGTIMSYCHVVGGNSINLNLGFHNQVRDLIRQNFIDTGCEEDQLCADIPPRNDFCSNAFELIPTFTCFFQPYDVLYTTVSGASPTLSCGNAITEKDAWFKVVVPPAGNLTIETSDLSNVGSDLIIEAYSGSCGTLTSISCDDNSGLGNQAKIEISDFSLAGDTLFVRVVEKDGLDVAFGICTYAVDLPCDEIVDSLTVFYNATGGSLWLNNAGWLEGVQGNDCDYCNWYGITCDGFENIIKLQLPSNNLNGSIGEELRNLEDLLELDLSNNNLNGNIPDIFSELTLLESINLSFNNLAGALPSSFSSVFSFKNIDLQQNLLSGKLPAFSSTRNMETFFLNNNNFSGCFPFSYYSLCNTEDYDLSGNSALAFNGNLSPFCSDFTGVDYDNDNYCQGIDDCDDYDETIFPDAPELCDGKDNNCDGTVDENLSSGPNVWVGPSSGSGWMTGSNWSLGHVPMGCEDIEIGMAGSSSASIDLSGQQSSLNQVIKSICIGPGSEINFGDFCYIQIEGGGNIFNQGSIIFNGTINISRQADSTKYGVVNSGNITLGQYAYLSAYSFSKGGLYNSATGSIVNNGYIFIDSNNPVSGYGGLINAGVINNSKNIEIRGEFLGSELVLEPGSLLKNIGSTFRCTVGGQSYGEETGN